MNKKKLTILLFTISLLMCIAMIAVTVSINERERISVSNSTEFKGTVVSTKIGEDNNDLLGEIQIEELDTVLCVNWIKTMDVTEIFSELRDGETIYYRIENGWLKKLDSMQFVYIVSLKTENENIFSIDDYNSIYGRARSRIRIATSIIAIGCAGICIYCIFQLKKMRKNNANRANYY